MGRPRKTENLETVSNGLFEAQPDETPILLPADDSVIENLVPLMSDPEWQDYVLSQLEPYEKDNGLPKARGLVRLVKKLLGPIIDQSPNTIQCPTEENDYRCVVEYRLVINRKRSLEPDEEPYVQTCTDVADAYPDNIYGEAFKVFQVPIASTRALARACRNALSIFVVSAEEVVSTDSISQQPISENQINKIDSKCATLNIDVMKYINLGRGRPGKPQAFGRIEEVSYDLAVEMYKGLNKYQQGEINIPEKVVGYKSDWREADAS